MSNNWGLIRNAPKQAWSKALYFGCLFLLFELLAWQQELEFG
jgi:hypothetical protein